MAGPRTEPTDVESPIPGASAQEQLASEVNSPSLRKTLVTGGTESTDAGDNASAAPDALSDEQAQAIAQRVHGVPSSPIGVSAPSDAGPAPELTDEQAQSIAQRVHGTAGSEVPSQGTAVPTGTSNLSGGVGFMARALLSRISPVLGIADLLSEKKNHEAPLGARILSAIGSDPYRQAQIFSEQTGQKTRLVGDSVERLDADGLWRPVSESYFKSLSSFVANIATHAPDLIKGVVQGGGSAIGAVAGTVGTAGNPVGGWVGATAGGAAAAYGAEYGQETIAKLLGASPQDAGTLAEDAKMAAAWSLATPAAASIARPVLRGSAQMFLNKIANSNTTKAINTAAIVKQFDDFFTNVTGAYRGTPGEAGKFAQSAAMHADNMHGKAVGDLWRDVEASHPGAKLQAPIAQGAVEAELRGAGAQFGTKPKSVPSDTTVHTVNLSNIPAYKRPVMDPLADMWTKMQNGNGLTPEEMREMLTDLSARGNYNPQGNTPDERFWQSMRTKLRSDRENSLVQLTKGTNLEPSVKDVFSEYSDKIEAIEAVNKAGHKSPEKFANALGGSIDAAEAARSVFTSGKDPMSDLTPAWDAIRNTYMFKHLTGTQDPLTGLTDVPKFYANLMKNEDVSNIYVGKEAMQELKGLSSAMSKLDWEFLLKHPDSIAAGGIKQALAKFTLSHGSPYHGANLLGQLVGHEPNILGAVRDAGLMPFASKAKTQQEKNFWLKSARMVTKLMDATQAVVPPEVLGGVNTSNAKYYIPISNAMIPVLLNAGTRDADEPPGKQRQTMLNGYQTYLEHAQAQAHALQESFANAQMPGGNVGDSVAHAAPAQLTNAPHGLPQMPQLNPLGFARRGAVHLRKH